MTPQSQLTPRQNEIAQLVCEGLQDREIGVLLQIATNTVSAHLRSTYERLNVHSRVQLVIRLREGGKI